MPSISIPIREAKEPIDSGRPYLKPSTKEKKEAKEKLESAKVKRQEKVTCRKKVHQERSSKSSPRDMVPSHTGTQYH